MRYLISLILIASSGLLLSAQSLSPAVISIAGGYAKAGNGMSLSWTLGEPVTPTLQSGGVLLTQGFQQPFLGEITSYEAANFDYTINTWPNPVQEMINIQTDYDQTLKYYLYDIRGHLYGSESFLKTGQVPVGQLPPGTYLLRLNRQQKAVKIILFEKF